MRPASPVRLYGLLVVLAVGSSVLALSTAASLDLPVRDPDGVAGPAWVRLPLILLAFFVADVVPRALRRSGGLAGSRAALAEVVGERWDRRRTALVAVGLAGFYACYVSYRNLKGALPFVRDDLYDEQLLDLDRDMSFGRDPATVLQDLLGTGIAAHGLSAVYLLFLAYVPLSLGVALVWARSTRTGAMWTTALSLNWLLGAGSYYLLPSLGPVFAEPRLFERLPATGVSALQENLLSTRTEVLADPVAAGAVQGIAGFASLHVSIVFTGVLVVHLLGLPRLVKALMWAFLVTTVLATVYFGWHYLVDDVAGLVIGAVAVAVAWWVTGSSASSASAAEIAVPDAPTQRIEGERATQRR